jgi:hypothetical protein
MRLNTYPLNAAAINGGVQLVPVHSHVYVASEVAVKCRQSSEISAILGVTVAYTSVRSLVSGRLGAFAEVPAPVEGGDAVVAYTEVACRLQVSASQQVACGVYTTVASYEAVGSDVALTDTVVAYMEAPAVLQLQAVQEVAIEVLQEVIAYSEVPLLAMQAVSRAQEVVAPIPSNDKVLAVAVVLSVISDSVTLLQNQTAYLILPNGTHAEFTGSIYCDEGSSFWQADLDVEFTAFAQLRIDDPVTVMLEEDAYVFIVDSRNRQPANAYVDVRYSIQALSPVVRFQKPRDRGLTVTYDEPRSARSLVEELLAGIPLDWRLLDWDIPANRLSIENADRLEIAQRIVAAPGGVLESLPDGSLVARYRYPLSPTVYAEALPEAIASTDREIFDYAEQDKINDYFNRVRVSDVPPDDYEDYIEYLEELSVLRAYTYPFDPEATLTHTSSEAITLNRIGVQYLQLGDTEETREVIEIVQGQGRTRYPIFSLTSFTYQTRHLGGISFDPDGTALYTADPEGYSLVEVVYVTRYIEYSVAGGGVREAQFLLNRSL